MNAKFNKLINKSNVNNVYRNFCDIVIMPTWYKMRYMFSHE